jgi:hypothetical protein
MPEAPVVSVVIGAIDDVSALIVLVLVLVVSEVEVLSPLLPQATSVPAIASIPRNFFMCL